MDSSNTALSGHEKYILDNMLNDMGYYGEWCFYVAVEQNTVTYSGYIPAMVFRDVQSYFFMNGPLYSDTPFVAGQTLGEAKVRCQLMNEHIGLDVDIVNEILASAGQALR